MLSHVTVTNAYIALTFREKYHYRIRKSSVDSDIYACDSCVPWQEQRQRKTGNKGGQKKVYWPIIGGGWGEQEGGEAFKIVHFIKNH
jgi:hypothetical protein